MNSMLVRLPSVTLHVEVNKGNVCVLPVCVRILKDKPPETLELAVGSVYGTKKLVEVLETCTPIKDGL